MRALTQSMILKERTAIWLPYPVASIPWTGMSPNDSCVKIMLLRPHHSWIHRTFP